MAEVDADIQRLKEATREAHEATQEARAAMRDLRRLRVEIKDEFDALFAQRAQPIIEKGLESYADTLSQATQEGYDRVIAKFDELKNLLLTGRKIGRPKSGDIDIEREIRSRVS